MEIRSSFDDVIILRTALSVFVHADCDST